MTKAKIVLVTGANRGIGFEVARQLAGQGAVVLLAGRELARAEAAAAQIGGGDVHPVELDVTSEESAARLAEKIGATFGRLDVLINNAGVILDYDPGVPPVETLRRSLAVNTLGSGIVTEAMAPLLAQSGAGNIVNLSSTLGSFGLRGDPSWENAFLPVPAYQASKAAINALTMNYARSLAEQGVRVNALCPGQTATETTFGQGRPVEETAAFIITHALSGPEGPTGTFFNQEGLIPW